MIFKKYVKIKHYVLLTLLPFLIIFFVFVIVLGRDIFLIKSKTQESIEETMPNINNAYVISSYISNLHKNIYLLAFADVKTSEDAAASIRETMSNNEQELDNEMLNRFLHSISATYKVKKEINDYLSLLHKEIEGIIINVHQIYDLSFIIYPYDDVNMYRHEVSENFVSHLRDMYHKVKIIINNTSDDICFNTRNAVVIEKCEAVNKSYEILNAYMHLFDTKMQLLRSTYQNASNEVSLILTEVLSRNDKHLITNLNSVEKNIQRLGSFTIYVCIALFVLFILLYIFIYFNFVKPLHVISNMISEFRHSMKIPQKAPPTRVIEIKEVYNLLLPLLNHVNYVLLQNESLSTQYKKMSELTYIDDLTQVNNRRSLNLFLKQNKDESLLKTAFLMVDIDFFKKLNDSAGHQKGDEVLYAIAQCLSTNIIRKDMVYRYGGEEFCIILLNVESEEALKTANRLVHEVEALQIPNAGLDNASVTVSIGVSTVNLTLDETSLNCHALLSQADLALYKAKSSGRNRACLYEQFDTENLKEEKERQEKEKAQAEAQSQAQNETQNT